MYDNMRRPTKVHYEGTGHVLFYGYNEQSQRTFIADNEGYNVTFIYDSQYRLCEVRQSGNDSFIAKLEYHNGVLSKKTLGNGLYTLYSYDNNLQLISVRNYYPNNTVSSSNSVEYDFKSRVVSMTDSDGLLVRYTYDSLGQVTGWTSSSGERVKYIYDDRGNRLVLERNGNVNSCVVNELNQYVQCNNRTTSFSYDLNGNMLQRRTPEGDKDYRYDTEGRLIETLTANSR